MNYYDREEWPHFLSAIRAAPTDDLPRMVAADWLEENGEPERAEFVRVQCEIAKSGPTPLLLYRENELFSPGVGVWESFRDRYPEFVILTPSQCQPGHYTGSRHLTVSRGFITTVRATLSALLGGECPRCGGAGENRVAVDRQYTKFQNLTCSDCHGTGRTVGVLRELVRREPVERIELSDREPYHAADGLWYYDDRHGADIYALPDDVLNLLGGEYAESAGTGYRSCGFPTESAARDALSAALIRWASQPVFELR